MLDKLQSTLCNMQGKLFENARDEKFDSENFVKVFMKSETAEDLDKVFNHMQWAGESYILNRLKEENGTDLTQNGEFYDMESLYWMGYIYRYWHYYTGESSKEIYKQAPAKTMRIAFLMYHTMSPEMAIDRLKETYKGKKKK